MSSPSVTVRGNSLHAVVIGGSIAGLLAARALHDRFDKVTVVDRDTLPDTAAPRRGVPQSRQLHGLLASGTAALEDSFRASRRNWPTGARRVAIYRRTLTGISTGISCVRPSPESSV
ncbi:hypothetical protein [Streptomyces sp. NPDC002547]